MTSVEMYRKQGYLPESLVNYLALLGWAAEGGEEVLSLEEIIRQIDLSKFSKNSPIFDFQKLRWMNSIYIRQYELVKITDLFIPHIIQAGYSVDSVERKHLEDIIAVLRKSCEILSDIGRLIGIFLDEVCAPDDDADTMLKTDDAKQVLSAAHELVRTEINETNFAASLIARVKEATPLKGKSLFMPLRAAITGRQKGPELDQAMPLIGFDRCRKRINYCYERYCKREVKP
jgi:nondiscriminating glutamyl-tRNA synthetase